MLTVLYASILQRDLLIVLLRADMIRPRSTVGLLPDMENLTQDLTKPIHIMQLVATILLRLMYLLVILLLLPEHSFHILMEVATVLLLLEGMVFLPFSVF